LDDVAVTFAKSAEWRINYPDFDQLNYHIVTNLYRVQKPKRTVSLSEVDAVRGLKYFASNLTLTSDQPILNGKYEIQPQT
jgi:hypothetical protein